MQYEIHELRTRMSILEKMLLMMSQTEQDELIKTCKMSEEKKNLIKFKKRNIM